MKIKQLALLLTAMILCVASAMAVYIHQTEGLEITSIVSATAEPNTNAAIEFTVENTGSVNISAVSVTSSVLSFNGNSINVPVIEDIVGLEFGASATRSFTVAVPSIVSGVYTGKLTIADRLNANVTDEESYTLTVNPKTEFSLSPSGLKISAQADDSSIGKFTITNTGSSVLNVAVSKVGEFVDDDYDRIDLFFSSVDPVQPGQAAEVQVTAEVESSVDLGTYAGSIKVTANGVEQLIGLSVEVEPSMCDEGIVGNLDVTITEPDNGEDFSPGDTMELKVKVTNSYSRDLDIYVEAILYDASENEEIASAKSELEEINDGKSETFEFNLEIPNDDIDEDNDFYLYVKAYKKNDEDEQCNYKKIKINLEREDDDVDFKSLSLDKAEYACGSEARFSVTVENFGTEDQDDVYIELISQDLQISLSSDEFDLEAYDDVGNRHTEVFVFEVPSTLNQGSYKIQAKVYYGSHETRSEYVILAVNSNACTVKDISEAKIVLSIEEPKLTVKASKKKFTIPIVIENLGGTAASFKLDVTEVSGWADILAVESPEMLNGKEKYHAYAYFQLKGDVAEGMHSLRVNLRDDDGLLASKLVDVEVVGSSSSELQLPEVEWLGDLFNDKNKMFWMIGDAILVLLALVFIGILLRR